MKKRITESQLRNIVAESAKKVLKEMREMKGPFYWSISLMEGEEVSRCVEDSATSDDAANDKFDTPEEAYSDGLRNLKFYSDADYCLEVYYFEPNGAGEYVQGYYAVSHRGDIEEY